MSAQLKIAIPAAFLVSFTPFILLGQHLVSGVTQSVPSMNGQETDNTFKNKGNQQLTIADSDSLGNFSTQLESGNYTLKSGANNHYLWEDTSLNINGQTALFIQHITAEDALSSHFTSKLDEIKTLSGTLDWLPGNKRLGTWKEEDRPIKIFPRYHNASDPESMPADFLSGYQIALNDIITGTDSVVIFNEQPSIPPIGIQIVYKPSDQIPIAGIPGYTEIIDAYTDGSPRKALISINRSLPPEVVHGVIEKEILRALGMDALSNDPAWVTYGGQEIGGGSQLAPGEARALKHAYLLESLTDMSNYSDSVYVTSVPFSELELPSNFKLLQNYPNPFNPSTTITFSLPRASDVQLRVFNTLGQEVATLANGKLSAGEHSVSFQPNQLASGLYFYRLVTGSGSAKTLKMMYLK